MKFTDEVYKVRPLKRLIQREIENKLAKLIISTKPNKGGEVKISAKN